MQKKIDFKKYGQYKSDLFRKLNLNFTKHRKLLDVGCGDGTDSRIFINEFKLNVYGIDVYKDDNIGSIKNLIFKKASILKIPYEKNSFDYVFSHDVFHHIDESKQDYRKHIKSLLELKRVCKENGYIIIVEANRYNPLFYFHMVKLMGHEHFKKSYFEKIIRDVFSNVRFNSFEVHYYPFLRTLWYAYEFLMENFSPKRFLAYNVAVIKNLK